ncbi:MAG TPA: hypothetical protein DCF42_05970 [Lachnospiraceae bacterium]|nr:hypothetical protein [Lachnospiraceae bacterium]
MNKSTNSTTNQTNSPSAAGSEPAADSRNAGLPTAEQTPENTGKPSRNKLFRLLTDREYWGYTLLFLGILLAIFFFIMLSGVTNSPTFTYAEF